MLMVEIIVKTRCGVLKEKYDRGRKLQVVELVVENYEEVRAD
jgi:hypothetical protein